MLVEIRGYPHYLFYYQPLSTIGFFNKGTSESGASDVVVNMRGGSLTGTLTKFFKFHKKACERRVAELHDEALQDPRFTYIGLRRQITVNIFKKGARVLQLKEHKINTRLTQN